MSVALLLAACSSPAPVRFHSLSTANDLTANVPPPAAGGAPRVVVAGVTVPSAVNQPQWLVRRPDNTLQALEEDRWASPLADEFRAALRAGLVQRWGVTDGSVPAASGAPIVASWRVVLEVLRLEARPGRDTVLDARWTLLPPRSGQPALTCEFLIREPVNGEGTVPLAEAHRRAVARLTDDIGRQLRASSAGSAGSCVGPATS